ncbi:MAG: hypothetical protein H0X43_08860 [Nitrosospira sp.]|nr:hypothetical protein [Nitrosospira sp.]
MSPLWRDRIQIFFAPDRVDLVRVHRGIKPEPPVRLSVECEHKPGAPAWAAPLEQLDQMSGTGGGHGAEVSITISNCFVRYVVLAAQQNIANPAELHVLADFHTREVYGEQAADWVTSVSAWDPSGGGVCAAMERALLEGLEEVVTRRKMRLKYVEPYLAGAFDHWHKRFDDRRAWFALVESGRLCLASLENGAWKRISNQRILQNVEDELLAALDQEVMLFAGRKENVETVYLFAPEHPELVLPEDCGWRVALLSTESLPAPAHYPSAAITLERLS